MVVLEDVGLVGEAEGRGDLDLVFRLVLAVASPALGGDEVGSGQRPFPGKLRHVIHDAVFVAVVPGLEAPALLQPQTEGDARVDHRLAVQHVLKIVRRDVDVRKDLDVRPPADRGAGLLPVGRLGDQLLPLFAAGLALFEVQGVFLLVAPDRHVHVLGGVLRGAGAESVKAEGVFVIAAVGVFVLAARVELAEHELPVEALFHGIPVQRAAAAEVLHLDGLVLKVSKRDQVAVALPRLVNGVGEDLKNGVLAAVQPVGAEDDARALAHAVCALELGDAVVAVLCRAFCHKCLFLYRYYIL